MLELNTLDVINQRKVEYIPPHFAKFKISDKGYFDPELENWIQTNLKGRYVIYTWPSINSDDKQSLSTCAAFEDHKELTFFMLACPYLRR